MLLTQTKQWQSVNIQAWPSKEQINYLVQRCAVDIHDFRKPDLFNGKIGLLCSEHYIPFSLWTCCSNWLWILHPQVYLSVSRYAKVFVCHPKQEAKFLIFPVEKKHRPLINHANLVRLQHSFFFFLISLYHIGIGLTWYFQSAYILPEWCLSFFPHHALDSTSVWQNGCSKLKIYFLAFVLRASEIENANAGNANLELSGAGA